MLFPRLLGPVQRWAICTVALPWVWNLPVALGFIDSEHRYILVNKEWLRLYEARGKTLSDWQGRHHLDEQFPEVRLVSEWRAPYLDAQASGAGSGGRVDMAPLGRREAVLWWIRAAAMGSLRRWLLGGGVIVGAEPVSVFLNGVREQEATGDPPTPLDPL